MEIRKYQSKDCDAMAELFYQTVHTVNAGDYTREQLNAWTAGPVDCKEWDASFLSHETWVAVEDGIIIGFGDIDREGYLDRLYVHKDYQRQGVAAALCDKLEGFAGNLITTHASITARPFFEKRGYEVEKEQKVEREGVLLTNYVMKKRNTKENRTIIGNHN